MTDGFITTVAIAAIGLIAAKMGDALRKPIFGSKPCDETNASRVAWSFDPNASQQQDAWQRVRSATPPCA